MHPIEEELKRLNRNRRWLVDEVKARGGRMGKAMLTLVLQGTRYLSDDNKFLVAEILGSGDRLVWDITRYQQALRAAATGKKAHSPRGRSRRHAAA